MTFSDLSVCRVYSAASLNRVINDPDVRPWVGPGSDDLDLSPVVANPQNVLMMGQGGGVLFQWLADGLYEAHTQFVAEARGETALRAVQDALRFMFLRHDATEIVTRVPRGNVAAHAMVRRIGGEYQFTRPRSWATNAGLVDCRYYRMSLNGFILKADFLPKIGDWFHRKLFAAKAGAGSALPDHDDDDAHDRYVGAAAEMIAHGQLAKGVSFYGRWAAYAGYRPMQVLTSDPIIDIGDAVLMVKNHDFTVLTCR